MKLRVLIIDDEALARARIRKLLSVENEVEIIGECENGPQAIAQINQDRPDLIFLDVQMPEVSGFDVLRALPPETLPAVIFVTAHDQHAIGAFEVQAVDFLLKPFTPARFEEALRRARRRLESSGTATVNQRLLELLNSTKTEPANLRRIAIKTEDRTLFIKLEDIDYFESAANYVVVHVSAETHILRETLTNLETKLPPQSFQRISRSILVNLTHVKELQPTMRGEYVVVLQDNRKLSMTRGLREVQERLQYS